MVTASFGWVRVRGAASGTLSKPAHAPITLSGRHASAPVHPASRTSARAGGPGGWVEAAAVPGIVSGGPRRRRGLRADPPGRDGGLGEEFTAPRPGRTDQGFGDWATAPDQSCACVNCMLSTNPGSASQCSHTRGKGGASLGCWH